MRGPRARVLYLYADDEDVVEPEWVVKHGRQAEGERLLGADSDLGRLDGPVAARPLTGRWGGGGAVRSDADMGYRDNRHGFR